jgi:hypothetical protein
MHISFKIVNFFILLCCSTCFGHHGVHHQELPIAAHAVSGHLSNYKHSICLQIMCGYAVMYNLFFTLVKICFYGTFYIIKPYKHIVIWQYLFNKYYRMTMCL